METLYKIPFINGIDTLNKSLFFRDKFVIFYSGGSKLWILADVWDGARW